VLCSACVPRTAQLLALVHAPAVACCCNLVLTVSQFCNPWDAFNVLQSDAQKHVQPQSYVHITLVQPSDGERLTAHVMCLDMTTQLPQKRAAQSQLDNVPQQGMQ
jgi:hypothetical protein